ncbi:clathrin interactor EPSIN 2 isoform X2 [Momordica charantia]|uniref:Clathrin interactor EPSIN 2 isoform X2 n=1 Tax=Momordica charantia TaxID=3673 RepID=A0A6J1C9G3_MOMCH|nr:clathrin interactor EPSIN 2 isoform X2 [Momordica charantia]
MKKAFDQTVRDLKREVNKTVLKIPKIEQKVLDATSNEPWGPHGTLLADIAQATRNYHEYQLIMGILWKRINDTGKNWRHVYKGLTVLEYLVGHGSERVIDDIREHSYQISTLSDFQYIDSSGRDQGNNVRKKSQNLVALVNDKERIIEVRQKAATNRDKFRNASSMGSMYRPSSGGGYEDRYEGRYGSRDGDRSVDSYGREREYGYDHSGRNEESYGRDMDRYGRDYEERYNRDGYRDDDYRGRSRSIDDQYGSRSRSSDRNGERTYDDDGQIPSRNSGARAEEKSQDGRPLERKFSEQNIGAPPSYEEAVSESGNTVPSQRDVAAPATTASRAFPPPSSSTPSQLPTQGTTGSPRTQEFDGSDEFDPRGSIPAAPTTSNSSKTDLLDALAIVPVEPVTSTVDPELHTQTSSGLGPHTQNQTFEDPFGDSPFKAISSSDVQSQAHFHRGQSFSAPTYSATDVPVQSQANLHHPREESLQDQNIGVLANLLPPESLPAAVSQPRLAISNSPPVQPHFPVVTGEHFPQDIGNVAPVNFQNQTVPGREFNNGMFIPQPQGGTPAHVNSYMAPPNTSLNNTRPNNFGSAQDGSVAPTSSHVTLQTTGPHTQFAGGNFNLPQGSVVAPVASQASYQAQNSPVVKSNTNFTGSFHPEAGAYTSMASQQIPPSAGSLSTASQASKNKFETKSTVWSDTLSRGLVNLNISGPKASPLADIGVDFEALNRKEKRMEKPSTAPVVSTINMGKAMGSGSGIGRAGAGALRPPPNVMSGSGMGMGMGIGMGGMGMGMGMSPNPGMGMGIGMRGYGGMNQPMGGMGMNMGMGQQGVPMQQPRANMPGVYNPMMGGGGYAPQQPPYGGYR